MDFSPVSQNSPVYSGGHIQMNPVSKSLHVAPLRQSTESSLHVSNISGINVYKWKSYTGLLLVGWERKWTISGLLSSSDKDG